MVAIDELVRERILELQTLNTRILEAGEGYPTILIHGVGFTEGAYAWLACINEGLAENLHVIAIDQLGWGVGDRPVWNYSFPYLVDHIRELQDVLGFEKTNIVGHSLGGWIATTLAYESPERVNKLVLVANAGLNPQPPASLANFQPPSREAIEASMQIVPNEEIRSRMIDEAWRNATMPAAAESFRKLSANFLDMDMRHRYFLRRRLPFIKAPTLIVYGSRDTGYPVETYGKEMHEGIRGSILEVLDSAHMIPEERPQELTKLMAKFLGQ